MLTRRERLARIVVAGVWLGGLGLALRLGITATDPSQVLGLLVAVYLGTWGLVFFLRPGETTANAARFLLVTASIGLAIGAFELPALIGRVDYRDVFHTPTAAWRRHDHRPDPDLIYLRSGNVRERRKFAGGERSGLSGAGAATVYESDVRYDAQGFRNPVALDRADVVVVGDSFVEGLHVGDDELMTTKLARQTDLSVANLGRSGDGPQQAKLILERFGLPKRPRVCVWVVYEGNDLEDAAAYEGDRAAVAALGPATTSRVLYERSFLRNALMFARRTWIAPGRTRPAALYRGAFRSSDRGEVAMIFASEDHHRPFGEAKWAKLSEAIREGAALCERQGTRLVVALAPTKFRVYREFCRFPPDSDCARWPSGDWEDRLRDEVSGLDHHIEFVDLTPALSEAARRGELAYLPDDTHWSAAGHASAARAITEVIAPGATASASSPRSSPRR